MENKTKNNKPAFFQNDFITNPDEYDNSKPPKSDFDEEQFLRDQYERILKEEKEWLKLGPSGKYEKEYFAKKKKDILKRLREEEKKKKSDFTDDKAFSKEKQLTKKKILATLVEAVTVFRSASDSKVKDRARKLYLELQEFITASDFTDDGKRMNYALVAELAESFEAWGTHDDPVVNQRVKRMYNELFDYIVKELNKKK